MLSMLITSHMLFVGFSLNDDNFHKVADGVKKAIKVIIRQTVLFLVTVIN